MLRTCRMYCMHSWPCLTCCIIIEVGVGRGTCLLSRDHKTGWPCNRDVHVRAAAGGASWRAGDGRAAQGARSPGCQGCGRGGPHGQVRGSQGLAHWSVRVTGLPGSQGCGRGRPHDLMNAMSKADLRCWNMGSRLVHFPDRPGASHARCPVECLAQVPALWAAAGSPWNQHP